MSDPELAVEGATDGLAVRVDHGLCSGTAHCQQSMPDVFTVQGRKSWIRADADWSDVDAERLEQTALACPWFAITVDHPEGAA